MDVLIPGIFSATNQAYEIAFVTLFISAISALVRKATVDFEKVKESREKMKEHQKAMAEAQKKGQTEKMLKAQEEMSKHMMEGMRQQFKPLLITLIPFILIFGYLNTTYSDLHPAMNVTIVDNLAANVSFENVKASDGGKYDPANQTVTWFAPLAKADNTYTVTMEADAKTASRKDIESNRAVLTYVEANGSNGPSVSSDKEAPADSIMSLTKNAQVQDSGHVKYTLTYANTATNNVVFFPFHADLWFIHIHDGFDWFLWYFAVSFICSIIINKLIGAT
jgi:uncharacterized membrane protein (DUF106 family)